MPYRCTDTDVQAIIDFDPSISDLTPFIAAAEELVTEVCQNGTVPFGMSPYTDTRLKQIEIWLAAHFLAVRDPRYQSEGLGAANASYQGQVGLNLSITPYGQQAALLDTHGGLAWLDQHIAKGKRARVGVTYLGTCKNRSLVEYPWRFFGFYNP